MFSQLEGYLNDFLSYVPLDDNHFKVYSLRLATIIFEAGPEILSAFDVAVASTRLVPMWEWIDDTLKSDRDKLWGEEQRRKANNQSLSFKKYSQFLKIHMLPRLDTAIVEIIDFKAYFKPFENEKPEWWDTYNQLKHEKYNSHKKATLETALRILGALFWLVDNNMHMLRHDECQSRLFKTIRDVEAHELRKI
jgi:hypothetical protein